MAPSASSQFPRSLSRSTTAFLSFLSYFFPSTSVRQRPKNFLADAVENKNKERPLSLSLASFTAVLQLIEQSCTRLGLFFLARPIFSCDHPFFPSLYLDEKSSTLTAIRSLAGAVFILLLLVRGLTARSKSRLERITRQLSSADVHVFHLITPLYPLTITLRTRGSFRCCFA